MRVLVHITVRAYTQGFAENALVLEVGQMSSLGSGPVVSDACQFTEAGKRYDKEHTGI